jgi:hypothetical protein
MTTDFRRTNPKETCGKALMQAICKQLKDPAGRIRAEDLIVTIASITGELCIDAAGIFPSRTHEYPPGQRVFSDITNKVIDGDNVNDTLTTLPSESVVGILRDRLLAHGYEAKDFPDRVEAIYKFFAANFGAPEARAGVPLSVSIEHRPRVLPMQVAYEARSIVDRAFERLGSDPNTRVRAAAHALAEALIAVKDVLPRDVALLLAHQTVNGMAKTAPMTDARMEAIKKGQYGPRPAPPTETGP